MEKEKLEWKTRSYKDVRWLEVDKSKPYEPFTITPLKTPTQPEVGL